MVSAQYTKLALECDLMGLHHRLCDFLREQIRNKPMYPKTKNQFSHTMFNRSPSANFRLPQKNESNGIFPIQRQSTNECRSINTISSKIMKTTVIQYQMAVNNSKTIIDKIHITQNKSSHNRYFLSNTTSLKCIVRIVFYEQKT